MFGFAFRPETNVPCHSFSVLDTYLPPSLTSHCFVSLQHVGNQMELSLRTLFDAEHADTEYCTKLELSEVSNDETLFRQCTGINTICCAL
jgi:hypothetical protein